MSYQIQRLTFGGILDQALSLMRAHFVTLTAGMMAVFVPFQVVGYAFKAARTGAGQPPSGASISAAVLWFLLFAVFMPFAQLMVTVAITDCYLNKPIDVAGSARKAWSSFRPYFGTNLIAGLAIMGGFLLFILPGIYFTICWSLIGPVVVMEHVYGRAAMKRSRALVKGHFGRTSGLMFVTTCVVTGIGSGLQIVLGAIPWLGAVLAGVISAITTTYASAVMVVMYIDLRCRHENFDLQLMASQVAALGGNASNTGSATNAPAA